MFLCPEIHHDSFVLQVYYRFSVTPISMNVYVLMGCLFCIGLSIGVVLAVGMLFVYQVRSRRGVRAVIGMSCVRILPKDELWFLVFGTHDNFWIIL